MTAERQRHREQWARTLGWGGSKHLAVITGCPECGLPHLATVTTQQPALLRHGGYGATQTTTRQWCPPCGWSGPTETTETRPA